MPNAAVRLEEIRRKRHWSQNLLSELSGVSRQTIRNIEHGTYDVKVSTLVALSKALECDIKDLFF